MPEKDDTTQYKTITIDQLKLGMYVKSISKNTHEMLSEGYVSSNETIKQLHRAKVTTLVIDPSKERKNLQIDKVLSDIKATSVIKTPKKISTVVTLDEEIKKANQLYNNAKLLQEKILTKIQSGEKIKSLDIKNTTDNIVDSIFRNQDALSCLSRLQNKDTYLMEHSLNVSILMSIFAKHLNIDKRIIQELTLGAFLHDIGKILLPKEILYKPGELTPKEFNILRSHVALGLKTLESTPSVSNIAVNMVREHHERLDGSGYPKQLKGNEISKYGRMIAIVDSYSAMTSERPYKTSVHPINAFKVLISESEQYDEELVDQFIRCLGVYPIGTLVKLNSGKLGMISQLNGKKPLHPYVRVFYNTRLNQAIPIEEINLSQCKYKDQIDCCIKPEEFNINLLGFFKAAFID